MKGVPILAGPREYTAGGRRERITVYGGLNYLRGNRAPYFSLTCDIDEWRGNAWRESGGGAAHDDILRHFPRFADLAALHLCDHDGAPMYAVENGWYWYEGGYQRFHTLIGHNIEMWGPAELRYGQSVTRQDQIGALSRHLRISYEASADLFNRSLNHAEFSAYVDAQRPRWQVEAAACIAAHGLTVFGDAYGTEAHS